MPDSQLPLERKLRNASDSLIATLDELYALEDEKRALEPGSPRFVELAARVESLARSVLDHSDRQGDLAVAASAAATSPGPAPRRIEEVPPRPIHAVLADWRAAERRLGDAAASPEEADLAAAEIRRLRDEYRRARERAERQD